ncbi:MAG: zinc ribbon domain-containing protein [Phycisphaerales bacterium]|nr:zinc ribbon domain-containing protein [Phycisphaerales bacterium]|tara:strand:- start:2757 stop:3065 length:309 start_codon:yes stop_codon:yes gene_type:complete
MPTYDYECGSCGHAFELFQSMSAPIKRKCPECKKSKLKRLIGTGSGVLFKGSGFYETDYRSESYKKAKKEDSSKKDSDKTKSGESKPKKETGSSGKKSTSGD